MFNLGVHLDNVPGKIAAHQRAEGLAGLDLFILVPAIEGGLRVRDRRLDQVGDLDAAGEGLRIRALELAPGGPGGQVADRDALEHPLGDPVGLVLLGGVGRHDLQVVGATVGGCSGLLDDVRQLVAQEATSLARLGPEPALGECDVIAHGVRCGAHGPARLVGPGIVMHADPAEVVAEPRFQLVTEPLGERPARRGQDLVDDPRGDRQFRRPTDRLPVEPPLRT